MTYSKIELDKAVFTVRDKLITSETSFVGRNVLQYYPTQWNFSKDYLWSIKIFNFVNATSFVKYDHGQGGKSKLNTGDVRMKRNLGNHEFVNKEKRGGACRIKNNRFNDFTLLTENKMKEQKFEKTK